jgi:hypothetical protein
LDVQGNNRQRTENEHCCPVIDFEGPRLLLGLSRRPGILATDVPVEVHVEGVGSGEPGEQGPELGRLFAGEWGQEFSFMLFGDPAQRSQNLRALGGQTQLVVPPVGPAAHARYQASRLQRIDEWNNAARHGSQAVGQSSLAQPWRAAEQAEHAGITRGQPDFAGALGEP